MSWATLLFEYLDEDVSHARLPVAGVPLARHDTDSLAIHLVMVQILQPLHGCIAKQRYEVKR